MAKIVIEIITGHRNQGEFNTIDADTILIGRGFDNNIILTDPYVSASHLKITAEGENIKITDLDSHNGTFTADRKQIAGEVTIRSGEQVVLGRTRLRIYLEGHQVQPTRELRPTGKLVGLIQKPLLAWGFLSIIMAIAYIEAHMVTTTNEPFLKLIASSIVTAMIVLMWAGFWALIGRLICHRVSFSIHIFICCLWFFVDLVLGLTNEYLSFYLNSQILFLTLDYLIFIIAFTLTLMASLTFSTNMTPKSKGIFASVFTILLVFFMTGLRLSFFENSEFKYFLEETPYDVRLKPPIFGTQKSQSVDQFILRGQSIFKQN